MPNTIELAVGVDDNYAGPAAVMLLSVVKATTSPLRLHIIDGGLSERQASSLDKILSPFVDVNTYSASDPLVLDLPTGEYNNYLSSASMSRLHLGQLLPDEIERVLYLDTDLLVFGDVGDLWETDLAGSCIGAVREGGWPNRCNTIDESGSPMEQYHGAAAPGYFNSGVMLMDLKHWRAEEIFEQCRDLHRVIGNKLRAPDQDILNIVFSSSWKPLPREWNTLIRALKDPDVHLGPDERWENFIASQTTEPARSSWVEFLEGGKGLVHYSGRDKPWHDNFPAGPVKNSWHDHARAAVDTSGFDLNFFRSLQSIS